MDYDEEQGKGGGEGVSAQGSTPRDQALWLFGELAKRDTGVKKLESKLKQRFVGQRLDDAKALAVLMATDQVDSAEEMKEAGIHTLTELDMCVVKTLCIEVDETDVDVMFG